MMQACSCTGNKKAVPQRNPRAQCARVTTEDPLAFACPVHWGPGMLRDVAEQGQVCPGCLGRSLTPLWESIRPHLSLASAHRWLGPRGSHPRTLC